MADTGIFHFQEPEFDPIERYSFSYRKVTRIGQPAMWPGEIDRQMHVSPDRH